MGNNNYLNCREGRIAHWDNVKFAMITLMVIGHFADGATKHSDFCKSIYLFIYAFHMPVMMFISGLFYSQKNLKNKTIYYISGGFATKIFLSIVKLVINHKTSFILLSDSGTPWFFFVLAIYQILMYLLRNINKWYLLVLSIIVACFVGYDKSIGDYLYLSRSIVFFPYYLSGNMVTVDRANHITEKYKKRLVPFAALCIAIWFCLCYFKLSPFYVLRHLFTGRNPFSDSIIAYGPLMRLLCYAITFFTGTSAMVLIPKKRIPFFTSFGTYTENVYFWHYGFYLFMSKYLHLPDIFMKQYLGKIFLLFLATGLSIVLSSVRLFDYPLLFVKKLCYKRN